MRADTSSWRPGPGSTSFLYLLRVPDQLGAADSPDQRFLAMVHTTAFMAEVRLCVPGVVEIDPHGLAPHDAGPAEGVGLDQHLRPGEATGAPSALAGPDRKHAPRGSLSQRAGAGYGRSRLHRKWKRSLRTRPFAAGLMGSRAAPESVLQFPGRQEALTDGRGPGWGGTTVKDTGEMRGYLHCALICAPRRSSVEQLLCPILCPQSLKSDHNPSNSGVCPGAGPGVASST